MTTLFAQTVTSLFDLLCLFAQSKFMESSGQGLDLWQEETPSNASLLLDSSRMTRVFFAGHGRLESPGMLCGTARAACGVGGSGTRWHDAKQVRVASIPAPGVGQLSSTAELSLADLRETTDR